MSGAGDRLAKATGAKNGKRPPGQPAQLFFIVTQSLRIFFRRSKQILGFDTELATAARFVRSCKHTGTALIGTCMNIFLADLRATWSRADCRPIALFVGVRSVNEIGSRS